MFHLSGQSQALLFAGALAVFFAGVGVAEQPFVGASQGLGPNSPRTEKDVHPREGVKLGLTDASRVRPGLGSELSVTRHLQDDQEFEISLQELLEHGRVLFSANWTDQEGAGRPMMKGTGKFLTDSSKPLVGSRSWNRISGPDSNSCGGCHNAPYGIQGGGGDFVANVFLLGQRFDFITFDPADTIPTRGTVDERRKPATLTSVANQRATTGMFGAGYIEMLAREMTADLQAIRATIRLGETKQLITKGVGFGSLTRRVDGIWDTSDVQGLPRASVVSPTPLDPPTLVVRPWHASGNVVSIREFSNNAYNQHHGIQTTERFGIDSDPDGDGFINEMTRADVTAVTLFQAAMQVPGRVIPRDPDVERAVLKGEGVFREAGCATCHVPALPLTRKSWYFSEPNPYNPPTNLRYGETRTLRMNLLSAKLPKPRLMPDNETDDVIMVPLYSDLKVHDINDGDEYPARDAVDMNQLVWAPGFAEGSRKFLTKRLWGAANEPPYFHHGFYTTLRQSLLAHGGEARKSRQYFQNASEYDQNALIEFLKTLQVLPPGTESSIVDQNFRPREWPPKVVSEARN